MLPASPRNCAPTVIHQHTHVHHHVHRVRHVHHKPAVFAIDGFDTKSRGRTRTRRASPRLASPSPDAPGVKGAFQRFMRNYGWTALAWMANAIIFIANRISFGFGFRVGYLPFFGDNRD